MATVIGICGSLRRGSYNRKLLRAASALAPQGLTVDVAGIEGIPVYDGDLEKEHGIPDAVSALKDRVAAADGLLLVTPEYNHSIPGAFKNAIDWMTRPPKDIARVFGNKPTGIIGTSPGRFGTVLAQAAWLPVTRTLGMRLYTGKMLHLSGAAKVFDDDGKLVDEMIEKLLGEYLEGFASFVGRSG